MPRWRIPCGSFWSAHNGNGVTAPPRPHAPASPPLVGRYEPPSPPPEPEAEREGDGVHAVTGNTGHWFNRQLRSGSRLVTKRRCGTTEDCLTTLL